MTRASAGRTRPAASSPTAPSARASRSSPRSRSSTSRRRSTSPRAASATPSARARWRSAARSRAACTPPPSTPPSSTRSRSSPAATRTSRPPRARSWRSRPGAWSGSAAAPRRRTRMAPMASDQATVAEEEYLQTIFWLQEAGLPMTGANVARAMQLSAPTVHEMVGRLERDGYITRGTDRALAFTDHGREHAEGIVRRHRLIERFLTDVLGIPWDDVHEEAERLEHAMSPVLEARMLAAIGDAKTCPHGHPIEPGSRVQGVPLADVETGAKVKVLRFENEVEDLLHLFKGEGVEPGREGTVAGSDKDEVAIDFGANTATLTRSVAETVSVLADPSPPPRTALPEQLVLGKERYGR